MEGLLPVWKERGMTSHDCVFKLRKILKTKKIGHSGTLDPDVDGVLPVAIGKATKVIEYMMDSTKEYVGDITLGTATTTEDSSGEIIEKADVTEEISGGQIDDILSSFEGEIMQTPPMYSAVKVQGKRLYEYAREGKVIERPSRKAVIYSFKRTSDLSFNSDDKTVTFSFKVECGKGTYVRTLAVDTGRKLGYPSHMSRLTREASSGFDRSQARTLAEISSHVDEGRIGELIYPLETALSDMEHYDLSEEEYLKVRNGSLLERQRYLGDRESEIVFRFKEKAVAIYKVHPNKPEFIKPAKVLRNEMEV